MTYCDCKAKCSSLNCDITFHFDPQHYENDADGLVTHLLSYVSKCGALDFDVKMSEFYDAGWVIPKDEVTLTSKLGKGEFGDVWEGKTYL